MTPPSSASLTSAPSTRSGRSRWRAILGAPLRFYRSRIYAQLIVSHLLVALLLAVLLAVGAFGLILGVVIPNGAPPLVSVAGVTEQTRILSTLITADDIAGLHSGDQGETAWVNRTLTRLVAAGQPDEFAMRAPDTAQDLAVLTDPAGTVLASSNPAAVPPGQPLDAAREPLLAAALARSAARPGQGPANPGDTVAAGSSPRLRAAAYPILGGDGQPAGVVLLQRAEIGPISAIRPSRLATLLAFFAAITLLLFTVPALVLATPFGAWRARRVARRLGSLEAAADDMAAGDLSRRVEPAGEDEIGRLGVRFNVMAASLEEADRQRRAFVANVSHELRTPIAVVQGNVERLLQTRDRGATEPPEELLAIQRETSALARLIDDLFTLARLDEAVLPIAPIPIQLARAVSEAVESVRGQAWDQRRVVVHSLVDTALPAVLADPTRLHQILGNLIHNALRYTPEGGVVVIDARRVDRAVEVSVTDSGVGIAPDDLEHVFERFYRGTGARGSDQGGGLGLAIVQQLVEAQGGAVAVESRPDEGTTFRFTLPVAPGREQETR